MQIVQVCIYFTLFTDIELFYSVILCPYCMRQNPSFQVSQPDHLLLSDQLMTVTMVGNIQSKHPSGINIGSWPGV